MLTAFWVSTAFSQESDAKAKEIVEKTFNKYLNLIKKEGNDVTSMAAKLLIKGGGMVPMGDNAMPMNLNVVLEIYVEKPRNFSASLVGNLGNAAVVMEGEKKKLTVLLPNTKQFAVIDVPDSAFEDIEKEVDNPEEEPNLDELWKNTVAKYAGTEDTKLGKAHKLVFTPKDTSEEGTLTIHILDGKWDPARVEFSQGEDTNVVIEIDKLDVNGKIPADKFVPHTEGFTEVTQDQLTTLIMMQVMGAMMGGGAQ